MGRKRKGSSRPTKRGRQAKQRRKLALVEGTLVVTGPNTASIRTEHGTFPVARNGIREGMSGDVVQASVVHLEGGQSRAYVRSVLERATTSFLGRYERLDPLGAVTPLDARIKRDFFVLPKDTSPERLGVSDGDVVSVRILEYPTRKSAGVVTIDRRIGSATELDLNVETVIASHGLRIDFPDAALAEAAALVLDVDAALAADVNRRDLRDVCCCTVDPTDARDFDDAVGARRTDDGGFEVDVHIADVSHYVRWDSSIDNEAKLRTCSVYLVDRVLPMLPERLCNDLCSLRPGEDRLCVSVRMRLDAAGNVVAAEAMESAINSSARLDYGTVDRLLAGEVTAGELPCVRRNDEVAASLALLDEVAVLRQGLRRERGAVDFETVESKVALDEDGRPTGVTVRRKTHATSLIEEAMLLANEAVAKLLADADVASAYRVHEQPSPDDLKLVAPVLAEFDLVRADETAALVAGDPKALQAVLARARTARGGLMASALLLRAQKRAVYAPANEGHYALGAPAYCHFTSPIRRYPDVIVHRTLKERLGVAGFADECKRQAADLDQLCRTCSEQERVADKADRESQAVKMAELFQSKIGEKFSGVVCGVERYGLFVMLDETCAEGMVPVRALGDEWFAYDAERLMLTGEETGTVYHLGKQVAVEVTAADPTRGQITFAMCV